MSLISTVAKTDDNREINGSRTSSSSLTSKSLGGDSSSFSFSSNNNNNSSNNEGPEWNISSTMVGREKESQRLRQIALATVANSSSTAVSSAPVAVVHGPAGVGKSQLIQQQPWTTAEWGFQYVAKGKFEQQRTVGEPYSALIEAMGGLIDNWILHNSVATVYSMGGFRQLLAEDFELLRNIFPKAYRVATANAGCCTIAASIHQKEQKQLENSEKKKQRGSGFFSLTSQDSGTVDCVHASFIRILQFLCQSSERKKECVVLWIEDVHWADAASYQVLQVLISGKVGIIPNMLLILSYRDEEVQDANHPMNLMFQRAQIERIEEIKNSRRQSSTSDSSSNSNSSRSHPTTPTTNNFNDTIHDFAIGNLSFRGVDALVATITNHNTHRAFVDDDTDATTSSPTIPLSQVIFDKTAGNPFFVVQFLLLLRREHFLRYSFSTFAWEWGDVHQLATAAKLSDNVADIVADSLQCLPEATRIAIQVASCLGKIVPVHVLLEYFETFFEESQKGYTCCRTLQQVQETGLRNILASAVERGILLRPVGQEDAFVWAHDKLQHVSYELIPRSMRGPLHIRLGKLLWRMSVKEPNAEWMVFLAADQLNRYSEYQQDNSIEGGVLGPEVASLCLEAAKLSLSKSALVPAYEMLVAGRKHLQIADAWAAHYSLSLELMSSMAELSILLGNKKEALDAAADVLTHAKTLEDKFHVQMVMLKAVTSGKDRNYQAGVQKSMEILRDYGIKFPSKLLPGQLLLENQKLKRKLPGGKLASLLDLEEMADPRARHIMKLLYQHATFSFMAQNDKDMNWYSVLRGLEWSADHGISEETALGIIFWASHLCLLGQFREAEEYAEMGLELLDRFPRRVGSLHASGMTMAAAAVFSRSRPLNKSLDIWLESHHVALRTGSTDKATASVLGYTYTYLMVGLPLGTLKMDLLAYEKEARQFSMPETVGLVFRIVHQFIINLQEDAPRPAILKGTAMDEDEVLGALHGNGLRMTKRDIHSFRLFLAILFGYWEMAEMLVESLEPFLTNDGFIIRSSLRRATMALACFKLYRLKGKRKHKTIAKKIMKELEKELKHGNVNAHPIFIMLKAEEDPSKENFDNGIRACARLGLLHFEAYLCERAADFFLEQKDEGWAEYYMEQAFVLYEDWGAGGKANRLKEEHAELLKSATLREKATTALKGRSRYSSEHADLLKEFDWERLSSMSTMAGSRTSSSELGGSSKKMTWTDGGSEDSTDLSSETSSERNSAILDVFSMANPMS